MTPRPIVIKVAISILLATMGAAGIFVISVASSLPRVWPGVILFFIVNGLSTFLILTAMAAKR